MVNFTVSSPSSKGQSPTDPTAYSSRPQILIYAFPLKYPGQFQTTWKETEQASLWKWLSSSWVVWSILEVNCQGQAAAAATMMQEPNTQAILRKTSMAAMTCYGDLSPFLIFLVGILFWIMFASDPCPWLTGTNWRADRRSGALRNWGPLLEPTLCWKK